MRRFARSFMSGFRDGLLGKEETFGEWFASVVAAVVSTIIALAILHWITGDRWMESAVIALLYMAFRSSRQ